MTYTYPDKITNALNHYTDYSYDLGTGNLLWEEKEEIKKEYKYDTFGRVIKEITPYDSEQLPTKTYTYYLDGSAPEIIKVSQRESASNYTDVLFFYDGFGNLVQIKNIIENNKTVTKNIFYDAQDKVKHEQNPYFEDYSLNISLPSPSINKTFYTYDALDRVTKVTNPDGTEKNTVFDKWTISDFDENNQRHDYFLDAYGRIVNILEYNINPLLNNYSEVYNTSYYYDTNDNLIKIIDNEDNEFSFTYDSLGRKIKMEDPDMGVWSYSYDGNNNLITQIDNKGNTIILSYDSLNRIFQKNSTGNYSVNISFSYDGQYWETLSNITQNGKIIRFTYDKRMRLINEEQYLNNKWIPLTTNYDSFNRIVERTGLSKELEYYYNRQGKINKITNYTTSAYYNPFGSLLNKTYANNLTSIFSYNPQNNRLTQIATGNIQNLVYSYDNVGNIMSLTDSVQKKNYTMTYDALDRLATTIINNNLYQYEFSSIGNIKRIVSNTSSKRLIYNGNIPHTPSEIVESTAGAGVYSAKDLDAGSRNRTFEFFLVKERVENITDVNWSINFGTGIANSNRQINISSISILVIVENNYSNGGTYTVNISTLYDANKFTDKWGVDAQSLNLITSNRSLSYLEFWIYKDIQEKSLNAVWNCNDIANSTVPFNITNNTMVIIEDNYTSPGDKNVICSVSSSDGSGNKSIDFEMKGLKIENYTITSLDTNLKQISFTIKNYWNPLIANWQIASDSNIYNTSNLTINDSEYIVRIINYTADGNKIIFVNASSDGIKGNYTDTLKIKALEINNYNRYSFNNTNRIIIFEVTNKWPANLSVNWNITDPSGMNSSYLTQNKSVMVIIEENYSSQGRHEPLINVYSNSFLSTLRDRFNIFIIHLTDLQILKQSLASTVTELITKSHSGNKSISWKYNSGQNTINSNIPISVNESKDLMIIIESNYTSPAVYSVNASVNSSNFTDNAQGVVVT